MMALLGSGKVLFASRHCSQVYPTMKASLDIMLFTVSGLVAHKYEMYASKGRKLMKKWQ
jgi:hypothetical protein